MTNTLLGAGDRYYVYRPLLDLIGLTEGTDKRRGGGEPARVIDAVVWPAAA